MEKQDEESPSKGGDTSVEEEEEEEEEGVMTFQEAMEEYEEMEKVSTAVLGASDPNNCSYPKGYMKRQALYACLTCNPRTAPFFQTAGVCLACSYKCHEGHEMVELYTKRNFRCDCGNKRLPDNPCLLQKERDDFNEKNVYSQNFSGLYCSCHRPYPDPEPQMEDDVMIQCIICEDWYHYQHVASPGAGNLEWDNKDVEQSVEIICRDCTQKLEFLSFYGELQVKPSQAVENKSTDVSDVAQTKLESADKMENDTSSQDSGIASLPEVDVEKNSDNSQKTNECPILSNSKIEMKSDSGTFWMDGWRKKLCRCDNCKVLYESLGTMYLLDDEDTIESYETLGKAKQESERIQAQESFDKQVNDMGHVGQIELISGYNDMKEGLVGFLKEFAENGKVVQAEDVKKFFEDLRATKRPRLDL